MQKLSAQDTLAAYQRINSGYSRKAAFQLTCARGFGSNINDMILAILYCLVNKLQFQLGTNCWIKNTKWEKYCVPFAAECDSQYPRAEQFGELYTFEYALLWKMRHPSILALNSILTAGLKKNLRIQENRWWGKRKEFLPEHFLFPELGIDGDIFHAKSVIARMILQPTAKVIDEHHAAMKNLQPYIAIHMRRGDRSVSRGVRIEAQQYLEKMQDIDQNIRNIFVATDDYRVVPDLQRLGPNLNIITFCNKDKKGYFHKQFIKSSHQEEKLVQFLVDLYYLANADYFIGSSSNVSRIVHLRREKETCSLIKDVYRKEKGWHAY